MVSRPKNHKELVKRRSSAGQTPVKPGQTHLDGVPGRKRRKPRVVLAAAAVNENLNN